MATRATSADLAAARGGIAHEKQVLTSATFFFETVQRDFWKDPKKAIVELEIYASTARGHLEDASREMQAYIKDKFENDIQLLTKHGARMRTAGANILLLKEGLVPALKIDQDNPKFRMMALQIFGYLRAEIEATLNLIM